MEEADAEAARMISFMYISINAHIGSLTTKIFRRTSRNVAENPIFEGRPFQFV